MQKAATIRVLTFILFFGLTKACLAGDWARSMEASTAATDYQAILDHNLSKYTVGTNAPLNKTSLTNNKFELSPNTQWAQPLGPQLMLKQQETELKQGAITSIPNITPTVNDAPPKRKPTPTRSKQKLP